MFHSSLPQVKTALLPFLSACIFALLSLQVPLSRLHCPAFKALLCFYVIYYHIAVGAIFEVCNEFSESSNKITEVYRVFKQFIQHGFNTHGSITGCLNFI